MLLINNVSILSMKDSAINHNKSVLIENGLIKAIDTGIPAPEAGCTIIDGKNKYLMPGLINMHTHLGDNRDDLMLYLINGITTIRNMWGYEGFHFLHWLFGTRVFNHLKLKHLIEQDSVIGPDIYTAGPLLDGDPPFFPKFMYLHPLKDAREIEKTVKSQAVRGYDFIKIYSRLSKQSFDDIMRFSNIYKMPVAGHVPDSVGLEHAIRSKIHSMEHLYGFVNAYSPRLNENKEQYGRLAGLCAANKVWNCPTLIANERLSNIERQEEFENEEQMAYVSAGNKKAMRFLIVEADKMYKKAGVAGNHTYMDSFHSVISHLKKEGAGILMGTDKSVPYTVAGFSEHTEMQLLSRAGLSNYEVIKAATTDAAKCLCADKITGTVEAGKRADLIITDKNPFDDLRAIFKHSGIIKAGKFYSREACNCILNNIKARAAKTK
jgi:imidazolonepropionase-like amidohydrolase